MFQGLDEKLLLGVFAGALMVGVGTTEMQRWTAPAAAPDALVIASAEQQPVMTYTYTFKRRPAECLEDVIAPRFAAQCAALEAQAPQVDERLGAPESAFAGQPMVPQAN